MDDSTLRENIKRFIEHLHGDGTFEIRCIGPDLTHVGTFDSIDAAAKAAAQLDGACNLYVTLNPIDLPATNCLHVGGSGAKDRDITSRLNLLIDLDPVRPSGTNATDAELRAAQDLADVVTAWLSDRGWPEPLRGMSGNGCHLLYRVSLAAQDGGVVHRVLQGLNAEHGTDAVKIDTVVHNAARITRLLGTVNCKASAPDRPRRRSHVQTWPAEPVDVTLELLQDVAALAPAARQQPAPAPATSAQRNGTFPKDADGVAAWLRSHGADVKAVVHGTNGGQAKVLLRRCPISGVESDKYSDIAVLVDQNGKLSYNNQHDRGAGLTWHDLRRRLDPTWTPPAAADTEPERIPLRTYTLSELAEAFPRRAEPVIDGLIRRGELVNLIASSKMRKSWFVADVGLCVAAGKLVLDRFATFPERRVDDRSGRVLYVDNELQTGELQYRLERVGNALGLEPEAIADRFRILPLRATPIDVNQLAAQLPALAADVDLVIVDVLYKLWPPNADENSNADVARVFATLAALAERIDAAMILVHHASKGSQADKSVVDVGSGAGALSRAADGHLVLRPHAEHSDADPAVVLSAVMRTFPPVKATAFRFDWPLWRPAADLDPEDLLRPGTRKKKKAAETVAEPKPVWTPESVAAEVLTGEPVVRQLVIDKIRAATGCGESPAVKWLQRLVGSGQAFAWTSARRNEPQRYANRPQPVLADQPSGVGGAV